MKKGLIMDMDGVIIQSEMFYKKEFQKFFAANGLEISDEQYAPAIGMPEDQTLQLFWKFWNNKTSHEEFLKRYQEYISKIKVSYPEILNEGVKELLVFCKENGIQTALASGSSKELIHGMLSECGLTELYDYVISGESMEKNKPDPQIYLYVMSLMGLKPEECIVIEDSPIGIQSAKGAGIKTIAKKPEGYSLDQKGADAKINSIIEAIDHLKD